MRGSLYKDISKNGDDDHDDNDDHNNDKDKYNGGFRCNRTVMTGTLQATRTNPDMFNLVTGEMRNSKGQYDFNDGIRYGTIEEEKIPNNDDAVWTAQEPAYKSAPKAASGG